MSSMPDVLRQAPLNVHSAQRYLLSLLLVLSMCILPVLHVQAKVDEQTAAKLKTTLTPTGAIRAGSESGLVPPWNGGIHTPPPDYLGPGSFYPDPFAEESKLFVVNQENVDEHKALLSDGHKSLIRAYPTFYLNVYPSHRTHAASEWLYENTFINATTTELIDNGNGLNNLLGGIPFPIPQSGLEILWNHLTRWRGLALIREEAEGVVLPNGARSMIISDQEIAFKFYQNKGRDLEKDILFYYTSHIKSPSSLAGGAFLAIDTLNQVEKPRQAWAYNAGQRRLRRVPLLAYDSPAIMVDSLRTMDEIDMFSGSPDRYAWRIIEKKELIVPYNTFKLAKKGNDYDEMLTPYHINPELVRNEVHRVWVIEGRLKPTARHIYSRRVFYVDEDSWGILIAENYDKNDEIWRVSLSNSLNNYEAPGVMTGVDTYHDLRSQKYSFKGLQNHAQYRTLFFDEFPNQSRYSPAALRSRSGR